MEQENKPKSKKLNFHAEWIIAIGIIIILIALLLPALEKPKGPAKEIICLSNLKHFAMAVTMYYMDNEYGKVPTALSLPTAEKWNEVIYPYLLSEKPNMCPSVKKQEPKTCTYFLNKNLYDLNVPIPTDMVLAFEGRIGWNQTGGPEDMVYRHGTQKDPSCNVVLSDGSHMRVKKSEAANLKWKP